MTRPPWWAGLLDATCEVACGGAAHRVTWSAGRLRAEHHDDADAEAALRALGADPPECLALVEAWRRHAATPELITLGRRPGEQDLGLGASADAPSGTAVHAGAPARTPPRVRERLRRREELRALMALPAPMIDRLVLTVLAGCADRWEDEAFRADHGLRVGAALSTRATPALRRFGERLGCGVPEVGVSPVHPDRDEPVVAARIEPDQPLVVSAELPVRWLSNVWGRGVSEPDGELVLDVVGGSDDGAELEVVVGAWEPAGPATWEAVAVPAVVVVDRDTGRRRVVRR